MNCEEVEELIGAYALGALPAEAEAAVREHLASCERHAEASKLQAVAASLAFAVPEREPSPALKTRLMTAVRAEGAEVRAPAPSPAAPTGFFERLRRWKPQRAVPYALAGALAVAVAALIVTNVGDSDDAQRGTVTLTGGDSAQGVLHVLEDGLLVMEADGLEPLDSEQTYQVWAIRAGRPESIGLLGPAAEGEVQEALRADLSGVEAVAVTVEPAGGSVQPSGARVLESEEISVP